MTSNWKCTTFSESPINFEFRHCWPLDQHVCSLKENSLLFLQGGLILVWSSFFATHTHCGRWVHENFSSSWALHWAWCFALVLGGLRWCLVQTIASQILSSPPHQCTQTNRLPVWNFPWDHKTALRLLVVRAEFSPMLLHSSWSW